ncbi:hypothetical protein D1007_31224 [Hordeum vulgare]|nr:hypothetical protein D1007_31224 [Hordeum vulgare]
MFTAPRLTHRACLRIDQAPLCLASTMASPFHNLAFAAASLCLHHRILDAATAPWPPRPHHVHLPRRAVTYLLSLLVRSGRRGKGKEEGGEVGESRGRFEGDQLLSPVY